MPENQSHHAILVGINEYVNRPLRWAVADAKALGEALQASTPKYSTTLLTNDSATKQAIIHALRSASSAPARTRIVFLAGHAAMTESGAYFVPHNAVEIGEMLAFSQIATILRQGLQHGTNLVVILDCCHAGALEIESKFSTEDLRNAVSAEIVKPNIAALLACAVGASAREDELLQHGVFSYHIINGLLGSAADSDGAVTPESLYHFVAKQLEQFSRQKPAYKADLAGRLKLVERPSQRPSTVGPNILAEADGLATALEKAYEQIAALKPPFASMDEYRRSGWQQASKIVSSVAEKRTRMIHRWDFGQTGGLGGNFKPLLGDIDALLADLANITVGTVTEFGPIVEKLGEGGFGNVFKVQSNDGTILAYKVYHPHELGNSAKLERFRIGYRAMDRIAHPQIVKVHKFVESPLSFYMNFVDGQNLRKWYGTVQDEMELIRIAIAISQIVEYAHGTGVLHRDIKPENVIMVWNAAREQWDPVLTDFDLAWFAAATSHTKEAFGAPFYAAPEQLSEPGKGAAHQPPVDVYSLAMLVIYLLTGRDPVVVEESLRSVDATVSRWTSQIAAQEIRDLLRSASHRKPGERLATARDFRDGLVRVRARLLSTADPDSVVDSDDFFNHLAATAGYNWKPQPPDRATIISASGRTESELFWNGPSCLHISTQKTGEFLAEGISTAQAKRALSERLTDRLRAISDRLPSGARLKGPKSQKSQNGLMVLSLENVVSTINSAATVARIVAEIFSVYEQF